MLLIYQGICAAIALLVAAVVLSPVEQGANLAGTGFGSPRRQRLGLQVTGAMVLVPLLLRLFLVK
jgi:hypothetical protein